MVHELLQDQALQQQLEKQGLIEHIEFYKHVEYLDLSEVIERLELPELPHGITYRIKPDCGEGSRIEWYSFHAGVPLELPAPVIENPDEAWLMDPDECLARAEGLHSRVENGPVDSYWLIDLDPDIGPGLLCDDDTAVVCYGCGIYVGRIQDYLWDATRGQ